MWRGAIYRQFLLKVAARKLCASSSLDQLGKVLFLEVSPSDLFFWLCCQVWSLTVSLGIVLAMVCVPGSPGCVIKV